MKKTGCSYLELKVPPPFVFSVIAICMYGLSTLSPHLFFTIPYHLYIMLIFIGLGAYFIIASGLSFGKNQTTVNPIKPESSTSLVTTGIYGLSRNPMYVGFLSILIGFAFFLSHPLAFLCLPIFVLYMNRFQIYPEERALTQLFEVEFQDYCKKVRRWL